MNEELIEMEKNMTTDSHNIGSKEDHNRRKVKKENSKENGKRMSQGEIPKRLLR